MNIFAHLPNPATPQNAHPTYQDASTTFDTSGKAFQPPDPPNQPYKLLTTSYCQTKAPRDPNGIPRLLNRQILHLPSPPLKPTLITPQFVPEVQIGQELEDIDSHSSSMVMFQRQSSTSSTPSATYNTRTASPLDLPSNSSSTS